MDSELLPIWNLVCGGVISNLKTHLSAQAPRILGNPVHGDDGTLFFDLNRDLFWVSGQVELGMAGVN